MKAMALSRHPEVSMDRHKAFRTLPCKTAAAACERVHCNSLLGIAAACWQRWHWGGLDGIVSRRGGAQRSWQHVLTHLELQRPS